MSSALRGLKFVSILQFIYGLICLFFGILSLTVRGYSDEYIIMVSSLSLFSPYLLESLPISNYAMFFGSILTIIGIINFSIVIGYRKKSESARKLSLCFAVMCTLLSFYPLQISALPFIPWPLIAYYLTRPHVKEYFKKSERKEVET